MRRRTTVVFEEFVHVSSSGALYTDARYDTELGLHDALAFEAVGDNAAGSGTCSIWVQQSGDAKNWLYRGSNSTDNPPADVALVFTGAGDIARSSWSAANVGVTHGTSYDGPMLSFVRLLILSTTKCHLKISYTERDGDPW